MQVYKARLDGVDDVAVRFIDSQPHTRDSVRAEFMTEINLLNACRHAGLVSFIGFWEQDVRYTPHFLQLKHCLFPCAPHCMVLPDRMALAAVTQRVYLCSNAVSK